MSKNVMIRIGVWAFVAALFLGIMLLVNRKVFQVPYTSSQKGKQTMEFPLSKVTVSIKKKVMLNCILILNFNTKSLLWYLIYLD